MHLIIVDLDLEVKVRIITLYRTFRPTNNMSTKEFFEEQISIANNNVLPKTVLLGDFNLDDKMLYRLDYMHWSLCNLLTDFTTRHSFLQMVKFPTWSRVISNVLKESTLDHIYVNNASLMERCSYIEPYHGDHRIVLIDINLTKPPPTTTLRRNWYNYSPQLLNERLSAMNLNFDDTSVQELWNSLENVLISVIDELAPLTVYSNDKPISAKKDANLRSKLNKRRQLLKKNKIQKSPLINNKIKVLNKEIRDHYYRGKLNSVRSRLHLNNNNSSNLWKAVKIAKDQGTNDIPRKVTLNDVAVCESNVANTLAGFFYNKINIINI